MKFNCFAGMGEEWSEWAPELVTERRTDGQVPENEVSRLSLKKATKREEGHLASEYWMLCFTCNHITEYMIDQPAFAMSSCPSHIDLQSVALVLIFEAPN